MAYISEVSGRKGLRRVRYSIDGRERTKYARGREGTKQLQFALSELELAARSRVADADKIRRWISEGYLTSSDALAVWPGIGETLKRMGVIQPTDWDAILHAYEDRAIAESKAHNPLRRTHVNTMGRARRVRDWWAHEVPQLSAVTVADVLRYRTELQAEGKAPWTVFQHLTATRILFDSAVTLEMLAENPARDPRVKLAQPKRRTRPMILTVDQAKHLLKASLKPEFGRLRGAVPTIVRHGLYAGLRDEEMRWSSWSWLTERRTLVIQAAEIPGERWEPKTAEAREIEVSPPYWDYLQALRERHESEGILCDWMIQGRFQGLPCGVDAPQKAFREFIKTEKMDPRITVYTLRHTFATSLLRESDLETVRERMGHSDIRTTQIYLQALNLEDERPVDRLPY